MVARRKARPPDPAKAQQGFVSRLVADPAPLSAFFVGILVFAPGVTLPRRGAGDRDVAGQLRSHCPIALIIVVVINVLLVWLPIVLHLVFPGATTRYLTAFNGWLRAHGKLMLICVLVAVGGIMVVNGIYGLAVDPMTAHRRITDPVEAMAQRVAERVVDLVLDVVDLNAIIQRVDLNGLMAQVDLNALLDQVGPERGARADRHSRPCWTGSISTRCSGASTWTRWSSRPTSAR